MKGALLLLLGLSLGWGRNCPSLQGDTSRLQASHRQRLHAFLEHTRSTQLPPIAIVIAHDRKPSASTGCHELEIRYVLDSTGSTPTGQVALYQLFGAGKRQTYDALNTILHTHLSPVRTYSAEEFCAGLESAAPQLRAWQQADYYQYLWNSLGQNRAFLGLHILLGIIMTSVNFFWVKSMRTAKRACNQYGISYGNSEYNILPVILSVVAPILLLFHLFQDVKSDTPAQTVVILWYCALGLYNNVYNIFFLPAMSYQAVSEPPPLPSTAPASVIQPPAPPKRPELQQTTRHRTKPAPQRATAPPEPPARPVPQPQPEPSRGRTLDI